MVKNLFKVCFVLFLIAFSGQCKCNLENPKYNIDIFAFIEDKNIGDPVIGETCKYLVEKICKNNNIEANIRLHRLFPPKNVNEMWISKFLRRQCSRNLSNIERIITYLVFRTYIFFNRTYMKYYKEIIKSSHLVIFGGGGLLKYVSQDFWASDYCILYYCDKYKVPVYLNAIGIEGYDENNFTSRLIKKLINKKCIKKITTRDDIDSLNLYRKDNNGVVGDPALYSNELYATTEKTNLIGINPIRAGIFNVNGFDTAEEELVKFYVEMIKRLEKDGFKWQIFTNGLKADYNLGLKILEALNLQPNIDLILDRPKTGLSLAQTISKYKGIIAGRMHAHIIATSYNIPTVGQIWNEKIKWFAKHLGCEERFFYPDELNQYDKIYKAFLNAMEAGNSKLNTESLKAKTFTELEHFIRTKFKLNNAKK